MKTTKKLSPEFIRLLESIAIQAQTVAQRGTVADFYDDEGLAAILLDLDRQTYDLQTDEDE